MLPWGNNPGSRPRCMALLGRAPQRAPHSGAGCLSEGQKWVGGARSSHTSGPDIYTADDDPPPPPLRTRLSRLVVNRVVGQENWVNLAVSFLSIVRQLPKHVHRTYITHHLPGRSLKQVPCEG